MNCVIYSSNFSRIKTHSLQNKKPWLIIQDGGQNNFTSRIDKRIYFLEDRILFESYFYKKFQKSNILGHIDNGTFEWKNSQKNFYERRGNFHSEAIFGMALPWTFETILPQNWQELSPESSIVPESYEVKQGLLKDGQESFSKIYKLFFRRYMPNPR